MRNPSHRDLLVPNIHPPTVWASQPPAAPQPGSEQAQGAVQWFGLPLRAVPLHLGPDRWLEGSSLPARFSPTRQDTVTQWAAAVKACCNLGALHLTGMCQGPILHWQAKSQPCPQTLGRDPPTINGTTPGFLPLDEAQQVIWARTSEVTGVHCGSDAKWIPVMWLDRCLSCSLHPSAAPGNTTTLKKSVPPTNACETMTNWSAPIDRHLHTHSSC